MIGRGAIDCRRFAPQEADTHACRIKRRSTAAGWLAAFGALTVCVAAPASAAPACAPRDFNAVRYTVCSFDARRDDIRLYWADDQRKPYGGFSALAQALTAHGRVVGQVFRRRTQELTRTTLVSTGLKSVLEPLEPISRRNELAGRSYRPQSVDCPVVHFIAADEPHSTRILDDPRFGWRDAAGERFSVNWVRGGAAGFFKHPTVGELAAHLRAVLEEVNSAEPLSTLSQ